jgi:Xaa-Pro aminopeptidase
LDRVVQFQRALAEKGMTAALVTSMENIRYLTGHYVWTAHSPTTFAIVPAASSPLLCVPGGDESLAQAHSRVPIESYDPGSLGWKAAVGISARVLAKLGGSTLGLEFGSATLSQHEVLKADLPTWSFADVAPVLAGLRLIKDGDEQRRLRAAGTIVHAGLEEVSRSLKPGISELELKGRADLAAYTEARSRFPQAAAASITNVLSGQKLSRLHDAAGGEAMQAGEPVFSIAHASVEGYWANIGRTLFVPGAPPDPKIQRAQQAVARAQRAAISQLVPGRTLGDAFRAADRVLAVDDLASRKIYGMFRGLGLRYDELPRPSDLELKVEPGMCICVQLHVRLSELIVGQGDSVLVTERGPEILSDAH